MAEGEVHSDIGWRAFTTYQKLRIVGVSLALILLLTYCTVLAVLVAGNSARVAAEQVQQQQLAQAQEAQQQQFSGFLNSFVAQQDYICMVEAKEATILRLPPPADSICKVTPPAVAPSPRATQNSSPTCKATPEPRRPTQTPAQAPTQAPSARPSASGAAPTPTQPHPTASPTPCVLGLPVCLSTIPPVLTAC